MAHFATTSRVLASPRMMNTYFPLAVIFFLVAGFLVTMLAGAILFGPKRSTAVKDDPFECGTIATGDALGRLSVKFYLVAMLFILFDIEVVFMYPWALQALHLGWYGFWAMLSFLFVVGLGLVYIWRRGVLDWS